MLPTPAVRAARTPAEAPAGERFTKWEPVAGLPSGPSRLVELRDGADGLVLTIAYDHPVPRALRVQFGAPLAHRRSSFEVFIPIWSMEVPYPWYTVETSRWIRRLHEETFDSSPAPRSCTTSSRRRGTSSRSPRRKRLP